MEVGVRAVVVVVVVVVGGSGVVANAPAGVVVNMKPLHSPTLKTGALKFKHKSMKVAGSNPGAGKVFLYKISVKYHLLLHCCMHDCNACERLIV